MSKRRIASRASSVTTESSEEYITPDIVPTARKRKKLDASEQCQSVYDAIRNFKKEDGNTICDVFVRAPKRRTTPEYYDVVTDPIDLLKIQQKIKTDSYTGLDDLQDDVELLVNNARAFYKEDSEEYDDACTLWDVFLSQKTKLQDGQPDDQNESKSSRPIRNVGRSRRTGNILDEEGEDLDIYEELFASVITAVDIDDRALHTMFQLLPSKKLYPEYYQVIDHPIDLKFIASKIQTNAYTSLSEMEKDLLQMTKNACIFNEPGSQIYKDAKALKKIFMAKRVEIETGRAIKSQHKRRGVPALSAITAALKENVESSVDEVEDEDVEAEGPMWQLFDILYNAAASNGSTVGAPLGESLWKLPNKRFHPDYYTTIKKPISMAHIRNKLKQGEYSNITEMTADLYLMLDNAKKWHPPTNKVHKDAEKMRKLLNQKLIDGSLEQGDDSDDDEDDDDEDGSDDSSSSEEEEEEAEEEEEDVSQVEKPKRRGRPRTSILPANTPLLRGIQRSLPVNTSEKKTKLLAIHDFLTCFKVEDRPIAANFLEKPPKKLYPDYYEVIERPIDMQTIEDKINDEKYQTIGEIIADYHLMFSNCRQYNEEGSQIVEDANTLERALRAKFRDLAPAERRSIQKTPGGGRTPNTSVVRTPKKSKLVENRCRQLYETILDYREPKAERQLSTIFLRLPSKFDYPDYYEIIKNPIDMETIAKKIPRYVDLNEISGDFALMFENACKFNEPDSQIYKDALALQQICIKTKQELRDMDNLIPDVQAAVQELLLSLLTSLYNLEDEEGRCLSDSLSDLPEYDEQDDKKIRGVSLDLIKRRLDKGLYKRLDAFQEDIFSVFERARRLSRTDSQVFEDSIEMQISFIKKRDEFCKNGDLLISPALRYTISTVHNSVDEMRQSKQIQEQKDEETLIEEEVSQEPVIQEGESSITVNEKTYSPGDFVYYELHDNEIPGILCITRIYTDADNVQMMEGQLFYRPYETYHVRTRRFLEQEVFKSDKHQSVPMSKVRGHCFVMSFKDFFRQKPEGFADQDVYVCESRYNTRARSFKIIKVWNHFNGEIRLVTREIPLEMNRIQSVFKNKIKDKNGPKEEINFELDLALDLLEKERPNVRLELQGADEENIYYEQYKSISAGVIKTGDFVYVGTETGKQCIAQIYSIWESKDGKSFFRGPWLLSPLEMPSSLVQTCYKQELMLSSVHETTPVSAIAGRCDVLEYLDYSTRRSTEIPEQDVYICESSYDEMKKQLNKTIQTGALRRFAHSQMVTPDEIFHFKRAVTPQKDMKIESGELVCVSEQSNNVDEMDTSLPDITLDTTPLIPSTPLSAISRNKPGGRHGRGKIVTGYILYSSEHRKERCEDNPGTTFGEISRMLGDEWRNMEQTERSRWEEKAAKLNEASKLKWREENAHLLNQSNEVQLPSHGFLQNRDNPIPNQVFDCRWEKCDYQFEDPADLLDHLIEEKVGCVLTHLSTEESGEPEYLCLWRSCIRLKRNAPAFPNSIRLLKHVRDVHVYKHLGKIVKPDNRSKNYVRRKTPLTPKPIIQPQVQQQQLQQYQIEQKPILHAPNMYSAPTSHPTSAVFVQQAHMQHPLPAYPMPHNQLSNNHIPMGSLLHFAAPPADPLFVTVPPRPQRVLHSDAYIKYIEGLQLNTSSITPYEKSIKAIECDTPPSVSISRLPTHWLGRRGREQPEEVVNALWDLRNHMMKDVVQLSKSY